jgi:hypothetical protein
VYVEHVRLYIARCWHSALQMIDCILMTAIGSRVVTHVFKIEDREGIELEPTGILNMLNTIQFVHSTTLRSWHYVLGLRLCEQMGLGWIC